MTKEKIEPVELDNEELENLDLVDRYDDPLMEYSTLGWKNYLLLYIILAIVLLFIIWANIAKVDELTRGIGKIIPSNELQVVQNLEGGIVDTIYVKEGDKVLVGDKLLRIRDIRAQSEYQSVLQQVLTLEASLVRLQAASEGTALKFSDDLTLNAPDVVASERALFNANQDQYTNQINVLEQQFKQREQQLNELREQIIGVQKLYELSREEYNMIKPLADRGTVSKVELLQVQSRFAAQEADLNNLRTSLARAKTGVEEAQQRINEIQSSFVATAQREYTDKSAQLASLRETLVAYEDRAQRTEIISPMNGIVQDIKITTIGGIIPPGGEIMDIVPLGDQLIVEASISPTDVAFVYPGQPALIKLTAYDYTIYGSLDGRVLSISADTFETERGEPYYRIRLQSEETTLTHNGEELEIIPGMVANVDILTGKKTVMNYLLKPFKKTLSNALHER